MDYQQYSISSYTIDRPINQERLSIFKCFLGNLTHYETPKMVRFENKWIGSLSLIVKMTLAIVCLYLMFQRDTYQIFDRSPISAVTIKVKKASYCATDSATIYYVLNYTCTTSMFDVNDFIVPAIENSAVSITTRTIEFEHILKYCNNTTIKNDTEYSSLYISSVHKCYHQARCILPPFYRSEYEHDDTFNNQQLCWFKLPEKPARINYQALDYIIFIKHFIEFTQLGLIKHNLVSDILSKEYISTCEYDPDYHPLCPKFRILKVLQMIEKNPHEYEFMILYGSLIEIKISWKCNLDRSLKYCEPIYQFERLDITPYDKNPYEPGSNFLTSRHFFRPDDNELHRIHTRIYNLHIIVSVTGEAGRFDLFQTTTSIGSFLGIFGAGSIACDLMAAFISNFKRVKYDT